MRWIMTAALLLFIWPAEVQAFDVVRSTISLNDILGRRSSGVSVEKAAYEPARGGPVRAIPAASKEKGSVARPGNAQPEKKLSVVSRPALPESFRGPRPVPSKKNATVAPRPTASAKPVLGADPTPLQKILGAPLVPKVRPIEPPKGLKVRAKAMYCLDCSENKVLLAHNVTEPLPIASITKLLTAMTVIDEMNLDSVLRIPNEIREVPPKKIGIRPGDLLTVKDLLHGMLIASGNDCAEALARAYPKGGRAGFLAAMNQKAKRIGATQTKVYTASGLDDYVELGRRDGKPVKAKRFNRASAEDVALIARRALKYKLISDITNKKRYVMRSRLKKQRKYIVRSNDRLLHRPLPVAVAKTGYTNLAGRCIVALFKDEDREHVVVVLNSRNHFRAAERIYRWACKTN